MEPREGRKKEMKEEETEKNILRWSEDELKELYEIINKDLKKEEETNKKEENILEEFKELKELKNNPSLYYLIQDIINNKFAIELSDNELKLIGLARIYKVDFLLPSRNLIVLERELKADFNSLTIREVQNIEKNLYNKIMAFRVRLLRYISKVCHEHSLGWITISKDVYKIVEELKKDLEYLKKDCLSYLEKKISNSKSNKEKRLYEILKQKLEIRFREYNIRVIPIFLHIDDAINVLSEIVAKIAYEKSEVEREINELEKKVKSKQDKQRIFEMRSQLNKLVNKYYLFSEKLRFLKS